MSSVPRVVVVIFDGVALLDASGPAEVFGFAGYEVVWASYTTSPIVASPVNACVQATHLTTDITSCDILVIPGGFGVRRFVPPADGEPTYRLPIAASDFLSELRRLHGLATTTLTVCTGSLLATAASIIADLRCPRLTTHAASRSRLQTMLDASCEKRVTTVCDARVVAVGKRTPYDAAPSYEWDADANVWSDPTGMSAIHTIPPSVLPLRLVAAAGVAAGIDAALVVVAGLATWFPSDPPTSATALTIPTTNCGAAAAAAVAVAIEFPSRAALAAFPSATQQTAISAVGFGVAPVDGGRDAAAVAEMAAAMLADARAAYLAHVPHAAALPAPQAPPTEDPASDPSAPGKAATAARDTGTTTPVPPSVPLTCPTAPADAAVQSIITPPHGDALAAAAAAVLRVPLATVPPLLAHPYGYAAALNAWAGTHGAAFLRLPCSGSGSSAANSSSGAFAAPVATVGTGAAGGGAGSGWLGRVGLDASALRDAVAAASAGADGAAPVPLSDGLAGLARGGGHAGGVLCIAAGRSPRAGAQRHCVVGVVDAEGDVRLLWDPYPSDGDGGVGAYTAAAVASRRTRPALDGGADWVGLFVLRPRIRPPPNAPTTTRLRLQGPIDSRPIGAYPAATGCGIVRGWHRGVRATGSLHSSVARTPAAGAAAPALATDPYTFTLHVPHPAPVVQHISPLGRCSETNSLYTPCRSVAPAEFDADIGRFHYIGFGGDGYGGREALGTDGAPAAAVPPPIGTLRALVAAMDEAMVRENGIGIAAPQIGVSVQAFLISIKRGNARYSPGGGDAFETTLYLNPRITAVGGGVRELWHGCLSARGCARGLVATATTIHIEAQDIAGRTFTQRLDGLPAVVFQHELRHLLGGTYLDRAAHFSSAPPALLTAASDDTPHLLADYEVGETVEAYYDRVSA